MWQHNNLEIDCCSSRSHRPLASSSEFGSFYIPSSISSSSYSIPLSISLRLEEATSRLYDPGFRLFPCGTSYFKLISIFYFVLRFTFFFDVLFSVCILFRFVRLSIRLPIRFDSTCDDSRGYPFDDSIRFDPVRYQAVIRRGFYDSIRIRGLSIWGEASIRRFDSRVSGIIRIIRVRSSSLS